MSLTAELLGRRHFLLLPDNPLESRCSWNNRRCRISGTSARTVDPLELQDSRPTASAGPSRPTARDTAAVDCSRIAFCNGVEERKRLPPV
jgi:hypothetical protein